MERATENRRSQGSFVKSFSSPGKGMEITFDPFTEDCFTSLSRDSPMKHLKGPKKYCQGSSPIRIRTHQNNLEQNGPRLHPSHSVGHVYSRVSVPIGPDVCGIPISPFPNDRLFPPKHGVVSVTPRFPGSSHYGHKPTPRERLSSSQEAVPSEPVHFSSSQLGTSCPRGVFPQAPCESVDNLGNHFPHCHDRGAQGTESKKTSSEFGNNCDTVRKHNLNKTPPDGIRSSSHIFHRSPVSPVSPTSNSRFQLPSSADPDNSHPSTTVSPSSGSPTPTTTHRTISCNSSSKHPASPWQSPQQQNNLTSPCVRSNPDVDCDCSPHKRRRDLVYSSQSPKKLHSSSVNSVKTQTLRPFSLPNSTPMNSESSQVSIVSTADMSAEPAHQELAFPPSVKTTGSHSTSTKKEHTKSSHLDFTERNVRKFDVLSNSNEKSKDDQKSNKASLLTVPKKKHHKSPKPASGHSRHHAKTSTDHLGQSRRSERTTSKHKSSSMLDHGKPSRARKSVPDDIADLFTPDPMTYIVSPTHKMAKPNFEAKTIKSPSEKGSDLPASCSSPVIESTSHKTLHCRETKSVLEGSSTTSNSSVSRSVLSPKPVKIDKKEFPREKVHEKSSTASPSKQAPDERKELKDNAQPLSSSNESSSIAEADTTTTSEQTSSSQDSRLSSTERQKDKGSRKEPGEDPVDVELDLDLSIAYDVDLTQSSESSEDEQLISLKEIMQRVTEPPQTPEKGAFSEPSTPVRSTNLKTLFPSTKPNVYKNSLDQMLIEMNNNKRAREVEAQLLKECKEELLKITEFEEENQEENISAEQQEFLDRYSLMTNAIRDLPPGEVVFNLDKFGRIFNQENLQLRQCMVNPQSTAQKTLLWSSPAQLRLYVNIGLFQEAYNCNLPCPPQVTRFLFKMMSVHTERMLSDKMLQALCDITCSSAYQLVKKENPEFEVWVPSLADVTLVLMNMGVDFVTLFPFEYLQPIFTEGDLLEDVDNSSTSSSTNKEQIIFPEHNCTNIFKYLSYCMGLCPGAYSDNELLMLLTIVGTISLDTQRILLPSEEVISLQYKIVNNIRDWDAQLPRICKALTHLTNDHHNMCLLVQLLPDNTRGKDLCRHLSLSMISKLLDGNCTYIPSSDFRLANLRPYLPRMQPSALLKGLQNNKDDDMTILDQQAYYLCYSLLTLTNEACNLRVFPPHQKKQLLFLSSELETYVKCDIRESEKCLYRSKVKDLVARIYTKWQMLLQKTKPLDGRLYDYWEPVETFRREVNEDVVEDITTSSDEEEKDFGTEENVSGTGEVSESSEALDFDLTLRSNDENLTKGGASTEDPNKLVNGMPQTQEDVDEATEVES